MGPRSEDRGNRYSVACCKTACLMASMGPRSEDRGNALSQLDDRHVGIRFNGAAIRRSRKCDPSTGDEVATDYASMGPRSVERGNEGVAHGHPARSVASMGPRSEERGNDAHAARAADAFALQWGRARRARKRGVAPCTLAGLRASMGPRSEDRGNSASSCHRVVQSASMGPRSEDRGNAVNGVVDSVDTASMGPRSDDRGNLAYAYSQGAGIVCFNGAAIRRSRKSSHGMHAIAADCTASMGPRSEDRGNSSLSILFSFQ